MNESVTTSAVRNLAMDGLPVLNELLCRIKREKFYPGLGLEPGPLALCANALNN